MNEFLAEAFTSYARRAACLCSPCWEPSTGGLVTDGPQLGSEIAEACEHARFTAPRFASLRNRLPSSALELGREALPGDLHQPVTSAKPPEASRPKPSQPPAPTEGLAARLAVGSISIHQLFLDGVYDGEVSPWLRLADAAADALLRGNTPPAVPTVIIGQDKLQPWARGIVWDCHDHLNCKPVERSTRHTIFPGPRQVDRAAFRKVASKSFRIGGATDWRDVFGADAERIITQRGRWHSDVAFLYQRALVGAHLRGSAAVGDAQGADLESLCRGWVQPATFR